MAMRALSCLVVDIVDIVDRMMLIELVMVELWFFYDFPFFFFLLFFWFFKKKLKSRRIADMM